MTYTEATAFLFGLRRFGWRLGLETIQRLLAVVGNPETAVPTAHIGGTNGKGSTAAMLSAIQQAAGNRTGLYTSPHLLSFTERIRVNGTPISQDQVTGLTAELKELCVEHFAQHPVPEVASSLLPHPTFFELTTAMAFLHFARQGAEAAVIEVGLGGRFDATNVLSPRVTAVTNVSLEHQEYLGHTLAEIATEKAGIIKPGVPVVTATRGEVHEVISRTATERGAVLINIHAAYTATIRESGLSGQIFDLSGPTRRYEALHLPLAGRHQIENAVTAIAAAEVLEAQGFRLGEDAIRQGLAGANWPGRLQVVAERPRILLDGAHNPAGAEALAAFLAEHRSDLHRLFLIFGVLRDKDWEAMLALLGPLATQVILTQPPADRGADPHDLITADRHCRKVDIVTDPGAALARARGAAGPEDTVVVTGSLYTVAAALRALGISSV